MNETITITNEAIQLLREAVLAHARTQLSGMPLTPWSLKPGFKVMCDGVNEEGATLSVIRTEGAFDLEDSFPLTFRVDYDSLQRDCGGVVAGIFSADRGAANECLDCEK